MVTDLSPQITAPCGLFGRSLLASRDASPAELDAILSLTGCFRELDRAGIKTPLFA